MVYYRKYRPQKISELDLPSVREKLTAILSSKELPHAFLFTGSKGLGKTSSARILAKAINCENKQLTSDKGQLTENSKKDSSSESQRSNVKGQMSDIEPCNECSACISITNGSNIDVLEIDAASNGGVEEMRTLRERVKFASSTLKYKVYIIDEVHMLSTGAFNALLKTLEEPPSHVIFILATTELWKLPPTVVSRTFQVLFEKPTAEQIANSLKRVVQGENLQVEEGVLEKIAHLSDGAFRDGAKLLEELVLAAQGKKITVDLFDTTFKTKGIGDEVLQLLQAYDARNAKQALEIINKLNANGADFKVVLERIVDHLRGLLMLRNGIESNEKDIKGLSIADIQELLELSQKAYGELKVSIIPQLPLELMTVKFCILEEDQAIVRHSGDDSELSSEEDSRIKQEPSVSPNLDKNPPFPLPPSTNNLLPQLITSLNLTNKPGAALLRSGKSAAIEGDELIITTPFSIHAERLKSEKVLPDLLKSAEEIVGKKIAVVVRTS